MDRGAWQATVFEVAKSQTQLKRLSTSILPGNLPDALISFSQELLKEYVFFHFADVETKTQS